MRVQNVKKNILNAFTQRNRLTWAQLEKLAKVSKGALSKHLNELIELKVVVVEIMKDERGRPKTFYILDDKKLHATFETSLYKRIMGEDDG